MNLKQLKNFYNKKPVEYIIKDNYNNLIENQEFIPRFSLKNVKEIANIPVNKPIKYSDEDYIVAKKFLATKALVKI